jgi:hypothetical protein
LEIRRQESRRSDASGRRHVRPDEDPTTQVKYAQNDPITAPVTAAGTTLTFNVSTASAAQAAAATPKSGSTLNTRPGYPQHRRRRSRIPSDGRKHMIAVTTAMIMDNVTERPYGDTEAHASFLANTRRSDR